MPFWLRADDHPEHNATVLTATLTDHGWILAIGTSIGGAWFHHPDTTKCMCPQPHLWSVLQPPLDVHENAARDVQRLRDASNRRTYHGPNVSRDPRGDSRVGVHAVVGNSGGDE